MSTLDLTLPNGDVVHLIVSVAGITTKPVVVPPPIEPPVYTETGIMLGIHNESGNEDALGATLGKKFAMTRIYMQWTVPPPVSRVAVDTALGKLCLVSHKPPDGNYLGWQRIVKGLEDVTIDKLAAYYHGLQKPIVFIFHHEPHDNGSTKGANGPDYVAAYRRIHDRFKTAGATNVKFGYCAVPMWVKAPDAFYPGDAYVDVECHDPYNWAGYQGTAWKSMQQILEPLVNIAKARGKKLILGEMACHPSDATHSRDQWFRDGAAWLKTQDTVIGFCYYNSPPPANDWVITENDGYAGWRDAFVNDPFFLGRPRAF